LRKKALNLKVLSHFQKSRFFVVVNSNFEVGLADLKYKV